MIISALVDTGLHGKEVYSVETIVVFDNCEFCGSQRIRCSGGIVQTFSRKYNIHQVYCECDPWIDHNQLNEEWLLIRELNKIGIEFLVDLNP